MERSPKDGGYALGQGRIMVWNMVPARLCLTKGLADEYRELVKDGLRGLGADWQYRNDLTLHRGPYIISAVMDESISAEPKVFRGLYADMLENDYRIIDNKEIGPDGNAILFDFSKIEQEKFRVIGTSARVQRADLTDGGVRMRLKTADKIRAFTRVRLPEAVTEVSAVDEDGREIKVSAEWDEATRTLLISYDSEAKAVEVTGRYG